MFSSVRLLVTFIYRVLLVGAFSGYVVVFYQIKSNQIKFINAKWPVGH